MKKTALVCSLTCLALTACSTTETSKTIQAPQVTAATAQVKYTGAKTAVSIGKFDNRSSYMRGIFSDNVDRLGGASKNNFRNSFAANGLFLCFKS